MQLKNNPSKGVRFRDLSGNKYGKLLAISPLKKWGCSKYFWLCKCDCGRETEVLGSNLLRGNSTTCGCTRFTDLADRTRKHGMTGTRMFKIWTGIRKRITNPKCHSYKLYGGRGISICERWDDFTNFYEDMKDGYSDELSLDRINPDGNYEPSNCRWANMTTQNNNRRNNRFITYGGKKQTLAQWSKESGIHPTTISNRIKSGRNLKDSIFSKTIQQTTLESISKYLVF